MPLNDEAIRVLKTWRTSDVTATGYVFPGSGGERLIDVKTAWKSLLQVAGVTGSAFTICVTHLPVAWSWRASTSTPCESC